MRLTFALCERSKEIPHGHFELYVEAEDIPDLPEDEFDDEPFRSPPHYCVPECNAFLDTLAEQGVITAEIHEEILREVIQTGLRQEPLSDDEIVGVYRQEAEEANHDFAENMIALASDLAGRAGAEDTTEDDDAEPPKAPTPKLLH